MNIKKISLATMCFCFMLISSVFAGVSNVEQEIKQQMETKNLAKENYMKSQEIQLSTQNKEVEESKQVEESKEVAENKEVTENKEIKEKSKETLTPKGNFTLVDDITINEINNSKEFLTITTKNGNYLYLVIDRTGNSENVYMMNLVDEADLMSLITGEPVTYKEEPVTQPPTLPEELEEEPLPIKRTNRISNLLLVTIILLIGVVFIWFRFFKNKQEDSNTEDYTQNEEEELAEYEGIDFDVLTNRVE